MSVSIVPGGLEVDGGAVPLISGSIHYWRHERALWSHLLDECQAMGFGVLCTYIPWSVHEIVRGRFDFGNPTPEKDVGAFLDLAHERGIKFIVRPGPHINSELTYFGYPKRVLFDSRIQARSATGTPVVLPVPPRMFPVPCHLSEAFQGEAALFLDALAPILKPRLHPGGPIVLVQIDNEWSYFFRYSAYEQDYSAPAVAAYRGFLESQYGTIEKLNEAYRTRHRRFDEVCPPTRFSARRRDEWPPYLDWIEARRRVHIDGLVRVKENYARAGIQGVPTSHNFPVPFPQMPLDVTACEEVVDVQGTDHYPKKTDYAALKKEACLLAGSSRLPFIPEFSCGFIPIPGYPITLDDERFTTLALFMHGLKAINFYMLVERERWAGSPITRDGRRREELFAFYRRLNEVFAETGLLALSKRRRVVLLTNRDAEKITRAANVLAITEAPVDLGALDPEALVDERDLGFGDRIQLEYGRAFEGLFRALSGAAIAFDIANAETIPAGRLAGYQAAVMPSFEVLARPAQEKLAAYVRAGGHLVLGPRLPSRDGSLVPCDELARLGAHPSGRAKSLELAPDLAVRACDLFGGEPWARTSVGRGGLVQFGFPLPRLPGKSAPAALAELVGRWLAPAGVGPSCRADDRVVETSLFEAPARPKVLFVANPSGEARSARVELDEGLSSSWRDAWTAEPCNTSSGKLSVVLDPYTVKIFQEIPT